MESSAVPQKCKPFGFAFCPPSYLHWSNRLHSCWCNIFVECHPPVSLTRISSLLNDFLLEFLSAFNFGDAFGLDRNCDRSLFSIGLYNSFRLHKHDDSSCVFPHQQSTSQTTNAANVNIPPQSNRGNCSCIYGLSNKFIYL
jgi:hypothetical protein